MPRQRDNTSGKVVLYTTCYGNRNHPDIDTDLVAVFEHNGIPVALAEKEACCGMPKLELGDLEAVAKAKEVNIPILAAMVDDGWDIVTPIPSCTLMYKQELPLMFPDDPDVIKVRDAMFDPVRVPDAASQGRQAKDRLFKNSLGKVSYQVPCHLRVQNIGLKTRDVLRTRAGYNSRCDRTLLRPRRHIRREEGIPRRIEEDRPARRRQGERRPKPITLRATARWPRNRSAQGLEGHDAENPMGLLKTCLRNL